MINVLLIISYDGTEYHGFQEQLSGVPTIGGFVRKAIEKIAGHEIDLVCAGRTDKGVHAEAQVLNFITSREVLKKINWIRGINSSLPKSIRVIACDFVPLNFSARFNAKSREYWYYINNAPFPHALSLRYASHMWQELNLKQLNKYCQEFVGEHDFSAFCSTLDQSTTKIRRIFSFFVEKSDEMLIFKIRGSAFLHNMVRILVGTVIDLHRKNAPISQVQEIILSKSRTQAGTTMPPEGLLFKNVLYEDVDE